MTLTTNQKKYLWLAGIAAVVYTTPAIVTRATRANVPQQTPRVAPVKGQVIPPAPAPTPFRDLLGKFSGRATLPGRGICGFQLEIRNSEQPGAFAGYSSLTCTPVYYWQMRPMTLAVRPTAAILTGTPQDDAIRFRVADMISFSACGPMTALSVKRFGSTNIAVEWQSRYCRSASMTLTRTGR